MNRTKRQDPTSVAYVVGVNACTLQNFAVVGALEVLSLRFGRGVLWSEAVRREVGGGLSVQPALEGVLDAEAGWLGSPGRLDAPGDAHAVDLIRRGLGGSASQPMQHLGEAETIRLLERTPAVRRVLLTDDRETGDMARRRGLHVMDTAGVLAEAFAAGELGCPRAYSLLQAMSASGRPVRVPPHHEVC